MSQTAKAIETVYNGYKFRSRLEARWAVFFDTAGIKYQYEPQGFELEDGTRYLPDFYFPDFELYGEVKGSEEQYHEDLPRMLRFLVGDNAPIKRLMVFGNIPYSPDSCGVFWFPVFFWETLANTVEREYKTIFIEDKSFFALDMLTFYGAPYQVDNGVYVCPEKEYGRRGVMWSNGSGNFREEQLDPIPDIRMNFGMDDTDYYGYEYPEPFREYWDTTGWESVYQKARQARFEYGETPKT